MSVKITENKTWPAKKWISFKLFRDCLIFVDSNSPLGQKIKFLEDVSIDTINLTRFDRAEQLKFFEIVNKVIEYNEEKQGTDMFDPSHFPLYQQKILELKDLLLEEGICF